MRPVITLVTNDWPGNHMHIDEPGIGNEREPRYLYSMILHVKLKIIMMTPEVVGLTTYGATNDDEFCTIMTTLGVQCTFAGLLTHWSVPLLGNTLRPRQNDRHFPDLFFQMDFCE